MVHNGSKHHCATCKQPAGDRCIDKGHRGICEVCEIPFALKSPQGCPNHPFREGCNREQYMNSKKYKQSEKKKEKIKADERALIGETDGTESETESGQVPSGKMTINKWRYKMASLQSQMRDLQNGKLSAPVPTSTATARPGSFFGRSQGYLGKGRNRDRKVRGASNVKDTFGGDILVGVKNATASHLDSETAELKTLGGLAGEYQSLDLNNFHSYPTRAQIRELEDLEDQVDHLRSLAEKARLVQQPELGARGMHSAAGRMKGRFLYTIDDEDTEYN